MVHYNVGWPIKLIEEYLVQSNHYNRPSVKANFLGKRETNQATGLALADKFDLKELRTNIFKNIEKANQFLNDVNKSKLEDLSKRTNYLLMRRCIREEPKELEDGELSNEIKTIVKIMDKFFLD